MPCGTDFARFAGVTRPEQRPAQKECRPRLLMLDDEEAILLPVAHYFRGAGYDVTTALEPEEAESLLDRRAFDLVILDLALTRYGREGLEVLRSIRERHPWLPVVVLSANVSAEVEGEARRLRVDAILSKPQPLHDLVRLADGIVGRRA